MTGARVTGPAGLDGGAAGYCKSGKHLWLCAECRKRCCNGYESVNSVPRSIVEKGRLEHFHPHTEPDSGGLGWAWKRQAVTP